MQAQDVYKAHKNRVRRLSESSKTSKENPIEKVLDRDGNIDILFTGSKYDIPEVYDALNEITYELRGIHTSCRILPEGTRDIRMKCIEYDKNRALELRECLEPIRKQVSTGLRDFAKELLDINAKGRELLQAKQFRNPREARRWVEKYAKDTGAHTPLLDTLEFYYRYRDTNCKPVPPTYSEILISGKKVTKIS